MAEWTYKTDDSSSDMLEQIRYKQDYAPDTLDSDSNYEMLGTTVEPPVAPTAPVNTDTCRTFTSGAIRDNSDGKGRMDLLPWRAIRELSKHCERGAKHYGEGNVRKGIPMHSLMDSGARHLAQYIAGDNTEPHHLVAALWNIAWAVEQQYTHPELNDLPWQMDRKE